MRQLTEEATFSKKKQVEMPGFEPGASYMRSKRSTTELHPQLMQLKGTGWQFVTGIIIGTVTHIQNTKGPAGIRTQDLLFTRQAL